MDAKTFLITGGNTGIGRACAVALAKQGAGRIVIASRSRERSQGVLDDLAAFPKTEVRFIALELADLAKVAKAADEVLALDWTIDALIDNAGVGGVRGVTRDGFELAFGTNHLGHFLFTEKLLPLVRRAEQGRVVIVSSTGHYRAKELDWEKVRGFSRTFSAFPEYCVSKLCNVLYAKELAGRLADSKVTTYSLHPGGVASDIWQRRLGVFAWFLKPLLITNEEGAKTQTWCATAPSLATESGLYYDERKPREPSVLARDPKLADELVSRSRAWVKDYL